MMTIARIVNCIFSVLGLLFGFLMFFLGGMMASFFPAFAAIAAMLPFIMVFISLVGLVGVVKNNIKIQIAFDICLLPAWYVGTLIGGLCLILFGIGHLSRPEKKIIEG